MAPERMPWFKFHTADWRGPALRGCSLAARGLWADCLTIMHDAQPRGYLRLDAPLSVDELALQVGRPRKEVRAALAELERRGVAQVDGDGCFYSEAMVRETERAEHAAASGRRGGNPTLKATLNPTLNGSLKPSLKLTRATRALTLSSSSPALDLSSSPPSSPSPPVDAELIAARFQTFWDAYPLHEKRKDALKIFTRLNPDHELLAHMLDGIARLKVSRRWRENYIPAPTVWLNGERWKDEVPPEPVPGAPFRVAPAAVPDNPKASDLIAARNAKMAANALEEAAERARLEAQG